MLITTLIGLALSQGGRPIKPVQNPKFGIAYSAEPNDFLAVPSSDIMGGYECSTATSRPDRNGETSVIIACGAGARLIRLTTKSDGTPPSGIWHGKAADFPNVGDVLYGTDNQTVRLEDGSVVTERDSATFEAMPPRTKPSWWSLNVTWRKDLKQGMRGGCALLKTKDFGKSWQRLNVIDFGTFEGGKYGAPRPMSNAGSADVSFDEQGKNPDGSPKWWIGGEDRTELYACPFTGNLYLTTRVIAGPVEKGDPQQNTTLVMGSTDRGATWTLMTTISAWSPTVMTSTPDGRLWLMQSTGNVNTLNVSGPTGRFQLPGNFVAGAPAYNNQKAEGPDKVNMELKVAHPSIARLLKDPGGSAVLISYQVKNSSGNQEFRIVKAVISASNDFIFSPVAEIAAPAPKTHSAMYGTFVQPELVGEPPSRFSDDTLFYWYDAPMTSKTPNGAFGVEYAMFLKGKKGISGYLSRKDEKPRTWTGRKDPGDYLKGASFVTSEGRVVFIPIWLESDGLHAAFVNAKK